MATMATDWEVRLWDGTTLAKRYSTRTEATRIAAECLRDWMTDDDRICMMKTDTDEYHVRVYTNDFEPTDAYAKVCR